MRKPAKNARPKFIPVLLCVLFLLCLCACDTFPEDYYFNEDWITGEDWLGAGKHDSVVWDSYSVSSEETKTFSFVQFSGIKTVFTVGSIEKPVISCEWDVTVESGKFKIVLIDVAQKEIVQTICEGSGSGALEDIELPGSSRKYIIRLVGHFADASGKITIRTAESEEPYLVDKKKNGL